MSQHLERPPELSEAIALSPPGGLDSSAPLASSTLATLPLGARLILRCRKDWRTATVVAVTLEQVTLAVASPSGHTYRVRRPADSPLTYEGAIPILGEGAWRAGFARYDVRW